MKVLILANLYPNNKVQSRGTFVYEQVQQLAKMCDISVVNPIGFTPPLLLFRSLTNGKSIFLEEWKRWLESITGITSKANDNIRVYHPKMFTLPKVVFEWSAGFLYFIQTLPTVLHVYRAFSFNLIHAHFATQDGVAAYLLGKLFRKKVIVTALGSDIRLICQKKAWVRAVTSFCLRRIDRIIAVSEDLKRHLVEMKVPARKIIVIPTGVNIERFKLRRKQYARQKLGLRNGKKIILYVGDLIELKGVHHLLPAMDNLTRERKDVILILVGDGDRRRCLKQEQERLGLERSVRFVGRQSNELIPVWYAACDLLCLPSYSEGWPTVLSEALMCGRPVVATSVGGVPEIIKSDQIGYMVPPGDSTALSQALARALEKRWSPMAIRSYAQNQLGLDSIKRAEQVYDVYNQILSMG